MKSNVEFNPSYSLLTIELEPGESIKAETGAMVAQAGVGMKTGMGGGGLFGGIRRMIGGESFFLNTFTGEGFGGWVSLAPPSPGDLGSFDLEPGKNLFIQGSSFLACTENVQTDTQFQGFRGFFSGESLFFIRAYAERGMGTVFYNSYGAIKQVPVTPEQELVVDTGHLVAFTDDVEYSIGKVGGIGSLIAGGEGLVMKFRGNGQVWIQTRNLASLADKLTPFLPKTGRN
ncbi:MAG: TIGR00266 family protein [Chloroflexi bacterium]|nr:TIGR00266 family protein [Chloroflexota bacterium]MYD47404.1 TIGR00266 family protein [Chloroflexota bacterium]